MDETGEGNTSCMEVLTLYRELLVSSVRSIQCILDNLRASGFLCNEDVEIVQRTITKPDQVRKILEQVQCKGEEACEYFIYILYKVCDAYVDVQPWLKEISYRPSEGVKELKVENTDPISRYCEKLRQDMGRDTCFIMSYGHKDETRLEDLYTDTLMELLDVGNESQGYAQNLEQLLDEQAALSSQGETILVTGDAGVGKSVLLQKLQNLWSKRELRTDALFFFKFRCRMFSTFKSSDEISLRDLLFKYSCYPDHDPDNEVFGYIVRFPEKVIFTFDGYDEIQEDVDLSNAPEVVHPEEKAHPLMLLNSLLCGKLLKGAKKVLTARTGMDIQSKIIRRRVALHGFSPAHLKTYVKLHFKEQEHRDLVSVQLDASPHLCGLCSIPLFSWIVFKSFKHLYTMHDDFELPDACVTLTDIFLLLSEVFLSHSVVPAPRLLKKSTRSTKDTFKAGLGPLAAFAKLALQGIESSRFICTQDEMAACGLTEEHLHMGFLRPVSECDARGCPAAFEFLHVTLQSFLAAFALVLDDQAPTSSILKFFTECSRNRHLQWLPLSSCLFCSTNKPMKPFTSNEHLLFTNLFLCGLLSQDNLGLMRHLVQPGLLKKKQALLRSYLSNSMRAHLHGLPHYNSDEGKRVHVLPNFLWTLRWIFENRSEDVAQLTAKGITANYIKLGYCNVFSGDCTALNFVLQHRRKLLGVDMDNNNIGDYGVKQLQTSFCKMTVVRLCVNHLTDSSIEVLAEELCKHKIVRVLGLYNNHITDLGAKLVAQMIEECPKLRVVKLGKNQITSVGASHLASAIRKSTSIFDVGMWGNSIGDEGAKAFAEGLRQHPSLTNLSLSANGITSVGGKLLAEALKDNTVLRIFWLVQNQLCDESAPDFAELVEAKTGLSHLWLISNHFTAKGIKVLAEALADNPLLKEICVKGNELSKEEENLFVGEKRLRFH